MLYKIIPGAQKEHVNKMISWIKEDEEVKEKAVLNYKLPLFGNKKQKIKILSF